MLHSFPQIMSKWQICLLAMLLGGAPLFAVTFPLPIPTRPTSFPLAVPVPHNLVGDYASSVVAWGYNDYGQTTVPAGLADVVQVAGGHYHTVALKRDGTVVAWGHNNYGQTTVPAGLADVVQVGAGAYHTVALRRDGTVVAWGWSNYGQTTVPAGLADVVQVAGVVFHTVALKLADTDGDALSDWAEVNTHKTDPLKADTDGDSMPDKWEIDNGLNPLSSTDALLDTDGDGLTNAQEYVPRTNPERADTDSDGLSDSAEVNAHRTDPLKADTDGDGLSDGEEINTYRTDPLKADTDDDGLNDSAEVNAHRTDPLKADTDGDGLPDKWEVDNGLNPLSSSDALQDGDGDGLANAQEYGLGTNPNRSDTDGDGLPDKWEVDNGLNPLSSSDALRDTDGDSLTYAQEYGLGTNPNRSDTDGDGLSDGAEASILEVVTGGPYTWLQAESDATARGGRLAVFATAAQWQAFVQSMNSSVGQGWIGLTDEASEGQWRWIDGSLPNFTNWYPGEPSGGYENYALWYGANASRRWNDAGGGTTLSHYALERIGTGTDPLKADTDGDGLSDGGEINTYRTDPLKADTDGDGLSDGEEANAHRTDPLKADTDGDGLSDGEEINTYRTDPLKADTDGDGLNDGAEVNTHRTDPLKADTDGDGLSDSVEGPTISTQFEVVTGGPYTWSQAKSDAAARGGRLAVFATAVQWQAFVQSMNSSVGQGWIGLTDEVSEGQWSWIDGSLPSFTDWYPGEPSGGIENYALWYSARESRRWNDAGANARLSHYALERTSMLTGTGTDPLRADTDGDGLPDKWEVDNGLNPLGSSDALQDGDGDGLTNAQEYGLGTNPNRSDTDGDGLPDKWEVDNGLNPLSSSDALQDGDGDGLTNAQEYGLGTNPNRSDTDGDGLSDGEEANTHRTDPLAADTDGDGLSDGAEVNTHRTDPLKADTDDDGYSDSFEILSLKSDPFRPNDIPAFVRVANPKNPDEDGGGYDAENAGIGYVGEEYDIATTEVTNLMYAAFLNAVAKIDSLYGLYSTLMGTDASGGIIRSGSSGSYSYAVKPGFENRPVNFVSLFDTLRYINWLHNGRPTVQVQDETSTENGAYKLRGSNPRQVVRNFAAKYFLPDQDEWHKAAFFDPAPGEGLPSDSYWPYADQTTTGPGGNFSAERTAVSGTSAAASHYGTYDQGGNVWEWTETVLADERRLTSQGIKPMSPSLVNQETADLGFRVGKTVQRSQVSPLVTPALTLVDEAYNLGDDAANNRGAVSYDFQMGTYEVTNAEYAAFLNAVAMTDSFYGLYNTRMGSDPLGGITRSGSNGSYVYSVKSGFANRPVNFITAFSAMRYCNWLHNGAQPRGDTESGAYRLLGNIPSNTTVLRRSAGARYYLPMEDEWYKAAFYDPSIAAMMTGNYWAYAVQSDTPSASTINFGGAFGGLSDVSTPGFPSYFGTYGQSGNAAEWTESLTGSTRIVRGGHYASATASVSYVGFIALDPSSTAANVGFRIAAARAMQNIAAFAPITDKTFGDVPFDITIPESSSGLPVTVRVQSGPATISGSTVTITGAGVVVLVASQEGDWDYDAARESSASFVVAKQTQTISDFSPIPTKTVGAAPFAVGIPTASSSLPVTLSVKSGPATISGNVVTLIGAGTVVLAANQPGNDNYGAAAEVLTTFTAAAGFDSEYQSWLDRHGLLSEHEQGLSDDANGDGVSNIIEFVMNRDPSSASAMEGVVPTMTSNELRITYNRRRDYALLGVQIYAETTSTLDPDEWTTSGVVERVISATETTETIEASVSMELAQKKFLRIRVVK